MQREAEPNPARIMALGNAYWGSRALLSAAELGLFTELARGPLDAEALQKRLGLHPRGARDFFDALVALGMLERDDGVYRNTPEANAFLDRAKPSYLGGILEFSGTRLYPAWAGLTEALRSGLPQAEVAGGQDIFAAMYRDPARLREFLRGMAGRSLPSARLIAEKFPWHRHRTLVDIGAALGAVPVQVALAQPHITGGGFDLPPVGPLFDEYVASFGLGDRLRFYPGDFFQDPLPEADVLVMGRILHDWDLEQKKLLLSKAYAALPAGGALIVYETIIDDERRENALSLLMSLNMLVYTPGGFDYTGADCQGWMRGAGFTDTYVEPLAGADSMVVGSK
jgi:hypothetical protein